MALLTIRLIVPDDDPALDPSHPMGLTQEAYDEITSFLNGFPIELDGTDDIFIGEKETL